jgi:hypothetical protein
MQIIKCIAHQLNVYFEIILAQIRNKLFNMKSTMFLKIE